MPGFSPSSRSATTNRSGRVLIAARRVGVVLIVVAAVGTAVRAALLTRRVKRQWLRSATALDFDPPAGVPAYAIDSPAPMVALVGVFSPKLIAARAVIDACSAEELAAHRRARARPPARARQPQALADDLRARTCCAGRRSIASIAAAWRDAAEDAADDAATRGEEAARRRSGGAAGEDRAARAEPSWPAAQRSARSSDEDGLDRRVRRLLTPTDQQLAAPWQLLIAAVAGTTAVAVARGRSLNPATLKQSLRTRRVGRRVRPLVSPDATTAGSSTGESVSS